MHIDKYKYADGYGLAENSQHFEDPIEFICCEILQFCGCGQPTEALKYVKEYLEILKMRDTSAESNARDAQWTESYKLLDAKPVGEVTFVLYVLTMLDLIEHGSSVRGSWLTENGKELLEDLTELMK